MTLADITHVSVLAAVSEFDRVGREAFLKSTGFGRARVYYLECDGRLYDSKAIVGYAHGVATGAALRSDEFSGGDQTVVSRLRSLGFTVRSLSADWTRDEVVLVCAEVVANGWRQIDDADKRALDLSELLQTPVIYPLDRRPPDFRNAAGVARKSADLATNHPGRAAKGTNASQTDHAVIAEFIADPDAVRIEAAAIRELLTIGARTAEPDVMFGIVDIEGNEGGLLMRRHLRRERDPRLRTAKVAEAKRRGAPIACEVCGFDFALVYGQRGTDYIECHHVTPLHVTGKTTTRLQDLALICSNCHRMIHRTRDWLTPHQLKALVDSAAASRTTP